MFFRQHGASPPERPRWWPRLLRVSGALAALLLLLLLVLIYVCPRLLDRDVVEHLRAAPPMRVVQLERQRDASGTERELVAFDDEAGRVHAALRLPHQDGRRRAAFVILGGLRTGRRAVELLDPDLPYAVAALDYASDGELARQPLHIALGLPRLHRDVLRTGVALRDLVRYLAAHPGIDAERIYLLGASLGSPLACAVAAAERPAGLALLYAFADHETLLEQRLRPYVGSGSLRRLLAGMGARATSSLDAAHTLPRLCGTPVLVVSSPQDTDLPRRCSESLWAATCAPRRRVELDGGHIQGARTPELLKEATSAVTAWVEELGGRAALTEPASAPRASTR